MKPWLAAVFMLAALHSAPGQKSPIRFGDIPMEDMKMKIYGKDSSAVAVILTDYGQAYVTATSINATLNFERHVRIKILKKEGLSWADAAIPLFHVGANEEKVVGLKASTYNLAGDKIVETKMNKDGTFKEKFNRYINLLKFTLPDVREGSVLEYSYTVQSSFITNFPNWQFQYKIPVRWSEYWAMIPEFFVMEKYMQGYLAPSVYEVKDITRTGYYDKAFHWAMKEVPAFKVEPFMTSENDYFSKMNFALAVVNFPGRPSEEVMGTWERFNERLLKSSYFGEVITGSGFLKKKVDELVAGETDQNKKVEKIYAYIRENFQWTEQNDFETDNLKDVVEKKQGSTGDLNLLLASMLEKAGFMVDMVLISTRDHGFVRPQYPMPKQFNYVVCAVRIDGKPILLDATERFLPMGVLPERCLNGQGLIISKNFHGWLPLETKTKARTVINADLSLDPSGDLKGKVSFTRDGYDAGTMRRDYFLKGEETYVKNATSSRVTWQIEKSAFENVHEITRPVIENHEVVINEHVTVAGDQMYINPFVTDRLEKNPFTLKERMYPVDYGSLKEKIYIAKITLPDGYEIDESPQNKMMALPGGTARYTYSLTVVGKTINIVSNFQISRNIYSQEEYPLLREFYDQVVAKQAEQIVIKKKP
jgi:hypothetical protein